MEMFFKKHINLGTSVLTNCRIKKALFPLDYQTFVRSYMDLKILFQPEEDLSSFSSHIIKNLVKYTSEIICAGLFQFYKIVLVLSIVLSVTVFLD